MAKVLQEKVTRSLNTVTWQLVRRQKSHDQDTR